MPFDLVTPSGRYRVPASLTVERLSIGGSSRVRFVRGYGSDDWFTTLDGLREPEPINLVGVLATDQDDAGTQALITALEDAAAAATRLVHVDASENDVAFVDLLGHLPVTTVPDGLDGTLVGVTAPLLPAAGEWTTAGESSA